MAKGKDNKNDKAKTSKNSGKDKNNKGKKQNKNELKKKKWWNDTLLWNRYNIS